MTDEELKPFIGKEVIMVVNDGAIVNKDTEVSGNLNILNVDHDTGTKWYRVYPLKYGFTANEFVSVKLKQEPKPTIPKGFIAITAVNNDGSKVKAFLKADKIVSVEEYPQKYDVKTKIEFWDSTSAYTVETIDEVIAKIAEALNG